MMSFTFDEVPRPAFLHLLDTIREHGVETPFYEMSGAETIGTFRSDAGSGTFSHDGQRLTVTIVRDNGHFSKLMIKGGLRQLVSEAVERRIA